MHIDHIPVSFRGCLPFDLNGVWAKSRLKGMDVVGIKEFTYRVPAEGERFQYCPSDKDGNDNFLELPQPHHYHLDPLDFCNASYISFICSRQVMITAATPYVTLVGNFWRVAMENKIAVMVNCTPDQDVLLSPIEDRYIKVSHTLISVCETFEINTVQVQEIGYINPCSHTLTYIRMTCWKDRTPTVQEAALVLAVMHRIAGTSKPIMAVCRSGSNRSCVMLASYIQHFHSDLNLSSGELLSAMRKERMNAICMREAGKLLFSIDQASIEAAQDKIREIE